MDKFKKQLSLYFLIAYIISWSIAVPLALSANGLINPIPLWLHYVTAYGPMFSAVVIIAVAGGKGGLKSMLYKITEWRIGLGWFLIAISPLTALAFIDFNLIGHINFLPDLGIFALPFWILTSGVGEEVGWRGFALPKLQTRYGALKSALILSIFWVGWHLPAFFYLPNYMKLGLTIFPMFVVGVVAGSIVYVWLYNSTKGNLLTAILFHGTFNFIIASKAGEGIAAAVVSSAVIIWAVCIILIYKQETLSCMSGVRR